MNVATAPSPTDRRQHVRVLWADDDPMIRTVMATNLEAEGFDVQTVADGDAAYEAAVLICPDVLVLDIMMPGRDGYAVLRALRSNPATASVPVVLLSAKATDAEVWEGWKAGADYYITKPFNPTELTDFIEHLVLDSSPDARARRRGRRVNTVPLTLHRPLASRRPFARAATPRGSSPRSSRCSRSPDRARDRNGNARTTRSSSRHRASRPPARRSPVSVVTSTAALDVVGAVAAARRRRRVQHAHERPVRARHARRRDARDRQRLHRQRRDRPTRRSPSITPGRGLVARDAGDGVGVALIDTGVNPTADLRGDRLVRGPDLSGERDGVDRFGHGTFMAGLIAGDGTASSSRRSAPRRRRAGRDRRLGEGRRRRRLHVALAS